MAEPLEVENNGKIYKVGREKLLAISPYVAEKVRCGYKRVSIEMEPEVFRNIFNVILGGLDAETLAPFINSKSFLCYKRAVRMLQLPRSRIDVLCEKVVDTLNVTHLADVIKQNPENSENCWKLFKGFIAHNIFKIVRSASFKRFDHDAIDVIYPYGFYRDETDSVVVLNEWFKANQDAYLYDLMSLPCWCKVNVKDPAISELSSRLDEQHHICKPGRCITGNCEVTKCSPRLIVVSVQERADFKYLRGEKWINLGEFKENRKLELTNRFDGYFNNIFFRSNRMGLRIDWQTQEYMGTPEFVDEFHQWNARTFAFDHDEPMRCFHLGAKLRAVPFELIKDAKTHVIDCVMGRFFKIVVNEDDEIFCILNLSQPEMFKLDRVLSRIIHCAVGSREIFLITPTRYFIVWDTISMTYNRYTSFDDPKCTPFNYNNISFAALGWCQVAFLNRETGEVFVWSLLTRTWIKLKRKLDTEREYYLASMWPYNRAAIDLMDYSPEDPEYGE